jgi:hypothetical protein
MLNQKISVSPGNKKIGNTPSVSLDPYYSCDNNLRCFITSCYALHMCKWRKVIHNAWHKNYMIWSDNPQEFQYQIDTYIDKKNCSYFRWHVGGDIPSINYWKTIVDIAERFKATYFVIYTKRYQWVDFFEDDLLHMRNLSVLLSMWPNEYPPYNTISEESLKRCRSYNNIHASWLEDDNRIQTLGINTKKCMNNCEICRLCWHHKGDIILKRH